MTPCGVYGNPPHRQKNTIGKERNVMGAAKKIEIPFSITVRDLAKLLGTTSIQVIKILMMNGVMANINQSIDFDTAAIVASEIGFEAIPEKQEEEEIEKDNGEVPLWR